MGADRNCRDFWQRCRPIRGPLKMGADRNQHDMPGLSGAIRGPLKMGADRNFVAWAKPLTRFEAP